MEQHRGRSEKQSRQGRAVLMVARERCATEQVARERMTRRPQKGVAASALGIAESTGAGFSRRLFLLLLPLVRPLSFGRSGREQDGSPDESHQARTGHDRSSTRGNRPAVLVQRERELGLVVAIPKGK